ncbi:aminotransferase, LLPSF_NHT_00031 family [Treponema socranskii subsp. socranskii VPI DR56BR1116 = ATCC 35536]|uniref:Aminotransferase, LLPSF_NHT_00031 family n=1 Tax=Treponema socranskii subsp. socranskii VPI DR56BR1116 = ATCC 35536 TaxID=1125725 RepID=A0ABN0P2V3_TRESO|nr:LegC family aminotransferase [Treponema socranskii]ERJ99794.1 aminotransferase, LLPSF_NHT_00031 family [Treponema socranskii subsp. socranskii VPI DR56BR1116 = ATCC 35536]
MMKYESTIHFIKQIYKNVDHVLLHAPAFIGNEKKYLDDCIDTTFVSSVGKYVDRFEDAIAKYTGANRAVVCVNGTMALFMALKLCGIKPDEKVITQPLTFIATANAIAYCYAHPVFLDVDEDTMGLSPTKVRLWLERNAAVKSDGCYDKHSGKKIRAVVPMHTFGHPVKIDDFVKLCDEWKLALIEDAAESIGSFYKGRHTGTYGEIGCMSFNGNKTITCGGGGILLFQNKEKGDYAKHITTQAKIPHRWEFKHDAIGYNLRMPNINAALGCAQLECIDTILANKRETSRMYKDFFSNIDDISFFDEPKDCKSNFWLNAVLLRDKRERDIFLAETNDNGIQTRPIWELMNRLPMFISATRGDLATAEMFADRIVNIPSGYRK